MRYAGWSQPSLKLLSESIVSPFADCFWIIKMKQIFRTGNSPQAKNLSTTFHGSLTPVLYQFSEHLMYIKLNIALHMFRVHLKYILQHYIKLLNRSSIPFKNISCTWTIYITLNMFWITRSFSWHLYMFIWLIWNFHWKRKFNHLNDVEVSHFSSNVSDHVYLFFKYITNYIVHLSRYQNSE